MPPLGRRALERINKAVVGPAAAEPATEPAATTLRLLALLISAKIEELRRAGSADVKQHRYRDCQRNQRAASGKDALTLVGHGLDRTNEETCPNAAIKPDHRQLRNCPKVYVSAFVCDHPCGTRSAGHGGRSWAKGRRPGRCTCCKFNTTGKSPSKLSSRKSKNNSLYQNSDLRYSCRIPPA